jgi:uncharacterized membrane protein
MRRTVLRCVSLGVGFATLLAMVPLTQASASPLGPPLPGHFITIDVPGAVATIPEAINNWGEVVGSYNDSNDVGHGYIERGGSFTTLDDPAGASGTSFAAGINDFGVVGGGYADADGTPHGFIYEDGRFTTIDDPLPGAVTVVAAMNDAGVIFGDFVNRNGGSRGFVDQGGHFSTIDAPGSTGTFLGDLNNVGDATGNYITGSVQPPGYAFVLRHGRFMTLSDPRAVPLTTLCSGLNDLGAVVGGFTGKDGNANGFLYRAGRFTTIDDPRASPSQGGTGAVNINDLGVVVGTYNDASGAFHGFELVP